MFKIKNNKDKYIGRTAHVIVGGLDRWGKITDIDSTGLVYGTWGPEVINPKKDYINLED